MRKSTTVLGILMMGVIFSLARCNSNDASETSTADSAGIAKSYGGFNSPEEWGSHLVSIGHCNDCHTPKKMTPMGPVNDSSLLLSGHPTSMPLPDIDRKELEAKGIVASQTFTSWIGPWGVSFAGNLTSDSTGVGNWKEDQFILCMRQGKWKGIAENRSLLPPMPWEEIGQMSDDELKAVFSYLKSTKPIKNVVPMPLPPVTANKM